MALYISVLLSRIYIFTFILDILKQSPRVGREIGTWNVLYSHSILVGWVVSDLQAKFVIRPNEFAHESLGKSLVTSYRQSDYNEDEQSYHNESNNTNSCILFLF